MISELFVETYIVNINNKYYLLITPHVKNSSPILYLHHERRSQLLEIEYDTVPFYAFKVRKRWMEKILRCTDDKPNLLFSLIYQYLNEIGIKKYYYDIWLRNHNFHARKEYQRKLNKINILKKQGKLEKTDKYIIHITQRMSKKEAAKLSLI